MEWAPLYDWNTLEHVGWWIPEQFEEGNLICDWIPITLDVEILDNQAHPAGYRWLVLPHGHGRELWHRQLIQDLVAHRKLRRSEEVHHLDHNKVNNIRANL